MHPREYDDLPRDINISIDIYYPIEILIFHEILKFPMGNFDIPMGFWNCPWKIKSPLIIKIFPWDFEISHGETNNPIGKFNFPLELTPLILIISP